MKTKEKASYKKSWFCEDCKIQMGKNEVRCVKCNKPHPSIRLLNKFMKSIYDNKKVEITL